MELPSGVGDESDEISFRADFTYATGIAKSPVLEPANAKTLGRLRYDDVGFFDGAKIPVAARPEELLLAENIALLRSLRPALCDKRTFGRLVLLGGSRNMPGALLMATKAAARSGVGLRTACGPESVMPSFSAALPEAMWAALPENETGG